MNKNGIVLLIIIVLIIIGGIVFATQKDSPTDVNVNIETPTTIIPGQTATSTATSTPTNTSTSTTATSTPVVTSTSTPAVLHTVTYTEGGFTPATLTIRQGDVVVFKNNSARSFWPASDDHPTHTIYPEFDPKQTVAAGDSWSFKFLKKGTWEYHDHRAASLGGTVIVQ